MLNALMILAAAATAASPSDTLVVPFPETVVSATALAAAVGRDSRLDRDHHR